MVDASNAFNTINREAAIHNIKIKCSSIAKFIENTYKEPGNLYIVGSKTDREHMTVIKSNEGTTQGDPVAMAMYALALSILQTKIKYDDTRVKQVAYADDLTGTGKLEDLKN